MTLPTLAEFSAWLAQATWLWPAWALVCLLLLGWVALRRGHDPRLREQLRDMQLATHTAGERLERELRDETARSAQATRQELGAALRDFQRALTSQAQGARDAQDAALQRLAASVTQQMNHLGEASARRLAEVRETVEQKLGAIQADNERQLEQMRRTVDEKLHATLEQRLGDSFRLVAQRLEQVHRGLGEMQVLAQGVGDLRRVLTNVKSRGIFGEVQLAGLLEQVFTPQQYATNIATVPGSAERVEFAVRLPGQGIDGPPVWLPLDAKFPREDYERLLDAQDRADREAADMAARALEMRIRDEARSIAAKYLAPPHTTDFAVLFVPTEGLYAELLRRPGLVEVLQREHRVTLAGPTTLLAMLNSLQMGFRTLALERRSSEVWQVLGAVKTEFHKFGDVLARTRRKLDEASRTIDAAQTRTRAMGRALKAVESLPAEASLPWAVDMEDGPEPGPDEAPAEIAR